MKKCYLQEHGFNIDLIRVSNNVNVITNQHKEEDLNKYKTTGFYRKRNSSMC